MSNQPNGEWPCLGAFLVKQGYGEKSQKTSMRDCFLSSPQSAASQDLVTCGEGGGTASLAFRLRISPHSVISEKSGC